MLTQIFALPITLLITGVLLAILGVYRVSKIWKRNVKKEQKTFQFKTTATNLKNEQKAIKQSLKYYEEVITYFRDANSKLNNFKKFLHQKIQSENQLQQEDDKIEEAFNHYSLFHKQQHKKIFNLQGQTGAEGGSDSSSEVALLNEITLPKDLHEARVRLFQKNKAWYDYRKKIYAARHQDIEPPHPIHEYAESLHPLHEHIEHKHTEHVHSAHEHTHAAHEHTEHPHPEHTHATHEHTEHPHPEHTHAAHEHAEHPHPEHAHPAHEHAEHPHPEHAHPTHEHTEHLHPGHKHTEHKHLKHGAHQKQEHKVIEEKNIAEKEHIPIETPSHTVSNFVDFTVLSFGSLFALMTFQGASLVLVVKTPYIVSGLIFSAIITGFQAKKDKQISQAYQLAYQKCVDEHQVIEALNDDEKHIKNVLIREHQHNSQLKDEIKQMLTHPDLQQYQKSYENHPALEPLPAPKLVL